MRVGPHAAARAEPVVDDLAPELVVAQLLLPESRRKSLAGTNANQARVLVQIEQLQRTVPSARSRSASKRTAPQWQLPR